MSLIVKKSKKKDIKLEENEIKFLREFKLMLMDGFLIKKHHLTNKSFSMRNIFLDGFNDNIYWIKKDHFINNIFSSSKDNKLLLSSIYKVEKNRIDLIHKPISKELEKKIVVIIIRAGFIKTKNIIWEFLDELTRDLFYDGLKLLVRDYKLRHNNK